MGNNVIIKNYDVRIPCKTKELAKKLVEVLVFSGYEVYLSYDTSHGDTITWDICYNAQPDEVTAVEDK